jgi:peptidoglycan/xylan/chitin deacetylase (PgdA/CDA1 family)
MSFTLPILTFHALDDQRSTTSFSPQVFRRGIARLHENGYRSLSLTDAADCLRRRQPFPKRSVVITFDDGYRSVHDEALPVLRDYGLCATVFLTVGERRAAEADGRLPSLSGRPMLSWSEIRKMHNAGISFGAHTLTHPDLTRLPYDRVETEICQSKLILEDALGAPVDCFAYPYGRYDRRSRDIVRQHFACACSDKLGLATISSNLYALERVDAYYLRTDRLFRLILTRLFPWYIVGRSIPRQIRRAAQGSMK